MINERLSYSRKTSHRPANFFYSICKSTKHINSHLAQETALKNFCLNGSTIFLKELQKISPKPVEQLQVRQIRIKVIQKSKKKKYGGRPYPKLNLLNLQNSKNDLTFVSSSIERCHSSCRTNKSPVIRYNDFSGIRNKVFQVPESLRVQGLSSQRLLRSMTPS